MHCFLMLPIKSVVLCLGLLIYVTFVQRSLLRRVNRVPDTPRNGLNGNNIHMDVIKHAWVFLNTFNFNFG